MTQLQAEMTTECPHGKLFKCMLNHEAYYKTEEY